MLIRRILSIEAGGNIISSLPLNPNEILIDTRRIHLIERVDSFVALSKRPTYSQPNQ